MKWREGIKRQSGLSSFWMNYSSVPADVLLHSSLSAPQLIRYLRLLPPFSSSVFSEAHSTSSFVPFVSASLSNQLFFLLSASFPGILETDITFLVIFSMVFLLSCYFACKYSLLHLWSCSFSLICREQDHLFWLKKATEVFECPFPPNLL